MTVSQKVALSLLVSVVLAAVFSVLAFTGFFNLIEARFYNPSIANSLTREVERDAQTIQSFLDELQDRFSLALGNEAVRRSFLPNQAAQDIFERTRIYSMLIESQRGIQSVRFVDAGGLRIHFSTDPDDVISRTNETISYRNYDEIDSYVPYADIAVLSCAAPRIFLDQHNERIIFSFSFYDSMEVYRGTAFYSLSVRAIAERLISEGRLKIGENVSIVSNPPGMVSGLPLAFGEAQAIIPVISSIWQLGLFGLSTLDSGTGMSSLALISAQTSQNLLVGRVINESLFAFPQSMRVILISAIFLTLFLSIFLAFNLRPDTLTVVQNRLKNLQLSLIREYYERKGEMDWNHWYRELEQRREDVRIELKRGIKDTPALLEDIDSLIDKSWDEILNAIGGRRETRLAIDEDKLQNILNRMLVAAGTSPVLPGGGIPSTAVMPLAEAAPPKAPMTAETENDDVLIELEELSEAEELSEVEELSETEELSEVEELTEAEELSEVEELAEAEELSEVEELAEAEELAETGEFSEVEELSAVEELSEADEFPDVLELEIQDSADGIEISVAAPIPSKAIWKEIDIASQIEFDDQIIPETETEDLPVDDFVIVSPFEGIRSDLKSKPGLKSDDYERTETKTSGSLEELGSDFSMSVLYKPFQQEDKGEPEELPALAVSVITEKNGINYIDKKVKTPDKETAKALDPGLKTLVDSVIGKKG